MQDDPNICFYAILDEVGSALAELLEREMEMAWISQDVAEVE